MRAYWAAPERDRGVVDPVGMQRRIQVAIYPCHRYRAKQGAMDGVRGSVVCVARSVSCVVRFDGTSWAAGHQAIDLVSILMYVDEAMLATYLDLGKLCKDMGHGSGVAFHRQLCILRDIPCPRDA